MNEKAKALINLQNEQITAALADNFNLPIFQDDVAEDERPDKLNLFLVIYGNLEKGESRGSLSQDVYVTYLAEDNNAVETDALDIISSIATIRAVNFVRSEKDRVQKLNTDEYVDRINFIFRRGIRYEC